MKLLDKEGLTYYTGKVKGQLATKQPLITNDNKLPYILISGTPDLTDYVKNTDYATNVKGGVLKTGNGTYLDGNGIIVPSEYSMSSYNDRGRNTFISKGTLENVLNARIGDIQTLLDNLDVGNGV